MRVFLVWAQEEFYGVYDSRRAATVIADKLMDEGYECVRLKSEVIQGMFEVTDETSLPSMG